MGSTRDPRATQLITLRVPPATQGLTLFQPEIAGPLNGDSHFGIVISGASQTNIGILQSLGKDVDDSFYIYRPPVMRTIPPQITGNEATLKLFGLTFVDRCLINITQSNGQKCEPIGGTRLLQEDASNQFNPYAHVIPYNMGASSVTATDAASASTKMTYGSARMPFELSGTGRLLRSMSLAEQYRLLYSDELPRFNETQDLRGGSTGNQVALFSNQRQLVLGFEPNPGLPLDQTGCAAGTFMLITKQIPIFQEQFIYIVVVVPVNFFANAGVVLRLDASAGLCPANKELAVAIIPSLGFFATAGKSVCMQRKFRLIMWWL
jgi:hypothetical protein